MSADVQESYTGPVDQGVLEYDAGNYINGVQMVTDRPIKVIGVATCAYAQQPHDTTFRRYLGVLQAGLCDSIHMISNTVDTTLAGRYTDSLMLLKPTSAGPSYLTGGPWRVENAHRYLPLPIQVEWMGLLDLTPPLTLEPPRFTGIIDSAPIVPLYEVMFDKPEVVTDSFIVAGTANNNEGNYAYRYFPFDDYFTEWMWLWNKRPTRYYGVSYYYNPEVIGAQTDIGYTPGQNVVWYKYRNTSWIRFAPETWNADYNWNMNGYVRPASSYILNAPVIFPIIDPDFDTTLCDEVSDVRQAEATDTTLTLMWDGGNNVEWEVEYFEMNTPTVLRVTTTVPMVTLTGLRERTNYMARVRGRCEWDTEFGEWSGYVDLWTGVHHDDPVSTEGNLGRFTQMMPNPTREQVTVLSSYRLSRVVVYDLGGRAVLEQEDDGLATTLDVSGLAKGVYVVAIHTPAGIATKRLVVEN